MLTGFRDGADRFCAEFQKHQEKITPLWNAAFRQAATLEYKPGDLVWLIDHYNTAVIVGPHVNDFTGAKSLVNFDIETVDADGQVCRWTYAVEKLRLALEALQFVWPEDN